MPWMDMISEVQSTLFWNFIDRTRCVLVGNTCTFKYVFLKAKLEWSKSIFIPLSCVYAKLNKLMLHGECIVMYTYLR